MATTATMHRPEWLPEPVWPFPIRTIDVDDAAVAYTDTGAGPTLLFVHAGQWSFVWRDVIAALRPRFRCVTFDAPGSGLSDRVAPSRQNLAAVRDAAGALIDHLDLRGITLVIHDLGGVTALAAAAPRAERFVGLAAVNTFGWRPSGPLFRGMLAVVGSGWLRTLDGWTRFLPTATSTAAGVGAHLDRSGRRAFRRGLDREAVHAMHRLFASARHSPDVYRDAARAVHDGLAHLPVLTVFGRWSDYLGLQPQWKRRFPAARQVTAGRFHFPMNDDPATVATALASWHQRQVVGRRTTPSGGHTPQTHRGHESGAPNHRPR